MDIVWQGLDAFGWVQAPFYRDRRGEDWQRREIEADRPHIERYDVPEGADRAFRDIVATCHANKIGVALLLTPEASWVRNVYTAQSRKRRDDYLRQFVQQNACGVIDGTAWVPDNGFVEGNHVTHAGAITFAQRFEQEVLHPLTRGGPALIVDRVDVPKAEQAAPIVASTPGSRDGSTRRR